MLRFKISTNQKRICIYLCHKSFVLTQYILTHLGGQNVNIYASAIALKLPLFAALIISVV